LLCLEAVFVKGMACSQVMQCVKLLEARLS